MTDGTVYRGFWLRRAAVEAEKRLLAMSPKTLGPAARRAVASIKARRD